MIIEFELRGLPKMTNSLGRQHFRTKIKEARKWKYLVALEIADRGLKIAQPLDRAMLTLTRHSSLEPDFDGLVSGFKHVLDGLVEVGVIRDDKSSVIGQPKYQWKHAKRNEGKVTVRVESIVSESGVDSSEVF